MQFTLNWSQHPSPFWFGAGRQEHPGIVQQGGVSCNSDLLELREGVLPPVGTQVIVLTAGKFLIAEPKAQYQERVTAEREARQLAANRAAQEREQERIERSRRWEAEAAEDNAALNIPVRWTSGLKTVLSGLSSRSNGSGDNSRSVAHVLLLDPIEEGRFTRRAGSFLCTSAGGSDGQAWTGKLHTHSAGVTGPYVSRITCKACLKISQRWTDDSRRVTAELVTSHHTNP